MPKDITLTFDVKCNAGSEDYPQGTVDLKTNKDLAQAFVMKPAVLESKLASVGTEPAEDKVVIALSQTDGTLLTLLLPITDFGVKPMAT